MDDSRRMEVLYGFIRRMKEDGKTFAVIGRTAVQAQRFLDEADGVNACSYRKFIRDHASEVETTEGMKRSLLDLLEYAGCGYRRKDRKIKAAAQEPANKSIRGTVGADAEEIHRFVAWASESGDYSPSYYNLLRITMRQFFAHSAVFDQNSCRSFIGHLESSGKSPSTIRLRICALKKYAEYRRKTITLKRPKLNRKLSTENVPTKKEVDRLLLLLDSRGDRLHRLWIRILITTGARVSEFLRLTWEDILCGDAVIKGKGLKYRQLFFQKRLVAEASEYVKETGATGPIAVNRYGNLITSRGIDNMLKAWGKLADIPSEKMHCHAFRHYFAKMYLAGNKDVVRLSELLGHSSIDTTRIYLNQSKDEQKRDFDKNVTW